MKKNIPRSFAIKPLSLVRLKIKLNVRNLNKANESFQVNFLNYRLVRLFNVWRERETCDLLLMLLTGA